MGAIPRGAEDRARVFHEQRAGGVGKILLEEFSGGVSLGEARDGAAASEGSLRTAAIGNNFFNAEAQRCGGRPRLPISRRLGVSALMILATCAQAQEWPAYGGDPGNTKYSAIKQINRANVTQLKVAWTYHTGDISDGSKYPVRSTFEGTPLVVDGVMYVTTPFSRVIALDPETGKQLWAFDPKIEMDTPRNLFISRGAAYWSDGAKKRIMLGTLDGRLFSIDVQTGRPDAAFGAGGAVDLRAGVAEQYREREYGMTSPPAVYKNVIICGSLTADGTPQGPLGDVRGFDARTGKLLWTFHVVQRPGEFGHETWEGESWKDRAAANAWSILTVDTERGIVFLPLTSPGTDFYGGDRKGMGLFGDSLGAVDALTGKRVWPFQTGHHKLWEYGNPAPAHLGTVERKGTPA